MSVVAGTSFTATLVDTGSLPVGIGARVEVPGTRAIVSAFQPAMLSGFVWFVTLEAPVDPGAYNLVWMDGATPPSYESFTPLAVLPTGAAAGPAGGVDLPTIQPSDVTPTLADVVLLERSRTRHPDDGTDVGTFDATTEPTDVEVTALITEATNLVLTNFHPAISPEHYDQIKTAVALLTAILIEGSFFRNQAETASQRGAAQVSVGVWRSMYDDIIQSLSDQIEQDLAQSLVGYGNNVLF
jgi:hypothetical protein